MADDLVARHFFNGFIRLHILYHAVKEPTYGAEITEELIRHGYRLSQGTLYPTLHQLEQLGYLRSYTEVVQGKRRRYYRGTPPGARCLKQCATSSWNWSQRSSKTMTSRSRSSDRSVADVSKPGGGPSMETDRKWV